MNEYMASDICSVEKDSCKLRLVHPFQCWCLNARGLHKHFKLLDYFKALKEKNRYSNQRTKCFCPKCDNELCGSDSYLELYNDINRLEYFKCSNCGEESSWDFDCICPILISHKIIKCTCAGQISKMVNGKEICADCDLPTEATYGKTT